MPRRGSLDDINKRKKRKIRMDETVLQNIDLDLSNPFEIVKTGMRAMANVSSSAAAKPQIDPESPTET